LWDEGLEQIYEDSRNGYDIVWECVGMRFAARAARQFSRMGFALFAFNVPAGQTFTVVVSESKCGIEIPVSALLEGIVCQTS
jgi:hypothetical protein